MLDQTMAENVRKLVAPKKKKRIRAQRHAPFPVPIRSIVLETGTTGKWHYYSGQLVGSAVMVTHSGDIHHLYNMGFFGKGNLSRSGLEHAKGFQMVAPHGDGEKSLRVMKRQSYVRHLNWKRLKEGHGSGNSENLETQEYDSDKEISSGITLEQSYQEDNAENNMADISEKCSEMEDIPENMESCPYTSERTDNWGESWMDRIPHEAKKSEKSAEALWDAQDEDADFWGVEETPKSTDETESVDESNSAKNVKSFHSVVSATKNDADVTKMEYGNEDGVSITENVRECENIAECKDFIVSDNEHKTKDVDLNNKNLSSRSDKSCVRDGTMSFENKEEACSENQPTPKISDLAELDSNRQHSTKLDENLTESSFTGTASCKCDEEVHAQTNFDTKILLQNEEFKSTLQTTGDLQKSENSQDTEKEPDKVELVQTLDPLCESHDPGGDLLVVSDSDDNDETVDWAQAGCRWERVIKHDPYKIQEYLHLSLEEELMNLTDMWQTFTKLKMSFPLNYIAYHHFRSKGWVPKSGIKFGVDYILYKEGPPFYHASYSVVVRLVDESTLKDEEEYVSRTFSWSALSGLNRITENVAKELMFCFVIRPSTLSQKCVDSPACIPQFKVQEMILKRWVPAQEREAKEVEEIL